MRKAIVFIIAAMLLLSACSQLDVPEEIPENTNPTEAVPDSIFLLTEEMRYDSKGNPYYKKTYSYDDTGRMISYNCILYAYDDRLEQSFTETYSYNDRGHLISFTTDEYSDFPINCNCSYQYTYNDDGTVSSYTIENSSGRTTNMLEYDQQGRFVRSYRLDEDGNEIEVYSCTYDNHGRVTTFKWTSNPPASFIYDDQGRVVTCVGKYWREYQYEGDRVVCESRIGEQVKWTYQYAENVLNGIILETEHTGAFGKNTARKYILNEYGKITKVQYDNGSWIEYQYKELESTRDTGDLRYVYFNILNEPLKIEEYYQDVMSYLLPRVQLDDSP